MAHLTVGQVMTRGVQTVPSHVPVSLCLKKMAEVGIRHMPVVDRSGSVVGIADDFSLLLRVRRGDAGDWVGSAITPSPRVASPETSVLQALEEQLDSGRDCTLVISAVGEPKGIFTRHDALELAAAASEDWDTVGQAMAQDELYDVLPDTPAEEALDRMEALGVHHLLVVKDEALMGVLSHRDLAGQGATPVIDVASTDIFHVPEDTALGAAARGMLEAGIGCLPVVRDGEQLVGLLTRTDVLRSLVAYLREHEHDD